jgi:hypothetical protein
LNDEDLVYELFPGATEDQVVELLEVMDLYLLRDKWPVTLRRMAESTNGNIERAMEAIIEEEQE